MTMSGALSAATLEVLAHRLPILWATSPAPLAWQMAELWRMQAEKPLAVWQAWASLGVWPLAAAGLVARSAAGQTPQTLALAAAADGARRRTRAARRAYGGQRQRQAAGPAAPPSPMSAGTAGAGRRLLARTAARRPVESLIVLAVLIGAMAILSPYFLSVSNFLNILLATSVIGVLAIGATFVIGSAGIDLSLGSVLGLSGVVGALRRRPARPAVAGRRSSPASLAGAFCGLINGLLDHPRRDPGVHRHPRHARRGARRSRWC